MLWRLGKSKTGKVMSPPPPNPNTWSWTPSHRAKKHIWPSGEDTELPLIHKSFQNAKDKDNSTKYHLKTFPSHNIHLSSRLFLHNELRKKTYLTSLNVLMRWWKVHFDGAALLKGSWASLDSSGILIQKEKTKAGRSLICAVSRLNSNNGN